MSTTKVIHVLERFSGVTDSDELRIGDRHRMQVLSNSVLDCTPKVRQIN